MKNLFLRRSKNYLYAVYTASLLGMSSCGYIFGPNKSSGSMPIRTNPHSDDGQIPPLNPPNPTSDGFTLELNHANWKLEPSQECRDSKTKVHAVVRDAKGNIYIGGEFSSVGGVKARNLARLNIETGAWEAVGAGVRGGACDGYYTEKVSSLLLVGDVLYIGGVFNIANDIPAAGIVAFSIAENKWINMSADLLVTENYRTSDHKNSISKIESIHDQVFIVGSTYKKTSNDSVVKWNGTSWSTLKEIMNNSYVSSLDNLVKTKNFLLGFVHGGIVNLAQPEKGVIPSMATSLDPNKSCGQNPEHLISMGDQIFGAGISLCSQKFWLYKLNAASIESGWQKADYSLVRAEQEGFGLAFYPRLFTDGNEVYGQASTADTTNFLFKWNEDGFSKWVVDGGVYSIKLKNQTDELEAQATLKTYEGLFYRANIEHISCDDGIWTVLGSDLVKIPFVKLKSM